MQAQLRLCMLGPQQPCTIQGIMDVVRFDFSSLKYPSSLQANGRWTDSLVYQ